MELFVFEKESLSKFRRRVETLERTEPFSKEEFEQNDELDLFFHKKFESYEEYLEFFYKFQEERKKSGFYTITTVGNSSNPWVLTRSTNDEKTKA